MPRPTAPIARGAPPPRGSRPPRKNAERQAREWPRKYGSRARVRFVCTLPCAACGYAGDYPRQNAHTPDPDAGAGRKGSYRSIIPLCGPCHRKQDDVNGGWLAIGMTAESCRRAADQTEALFQAHRLSHTDEDPDA